MGLRMCRNLCVLSSNNLPVAGRILLWRWDRDAAGAVVPCHHPIVSLLQSLEFRQDQQTEPPNQRPMIQNLKMTKNEIASWEWNQNERPATDKSRTRAEEELIKSWTRTKQELNKNWTRAEQEMNKSWTRTEQELNKNWTRAERELNESWTRADKTTDKTIIGVQDSLQ